MKICWDNLEKLKYKNNNFYIKSLLYVECSFTCKKCNEFYLVYKNRKFPLYCSLSCSNSDERNTPDIVREKISNSLKGNKNSLGYKHSEKTKEKLRDINTGKKLTEETKEKISNIHKGRKISEETKQKMSEASTGKFNSSWKGGYYLNNIPRYETYIEKLKFIHECRRSEEDQNVLEVKCTYCSRWYTPTLKDIIRRIRGINGNGGNNLYCSKECKQECSIYNKRKYPKGFKPSTSREVQPELRKLVFERDNWSCVKCKEVKNLHCHHIDPVVNNPIESVDIDNCITLCKNCHRNIHKLPGCTYNELRC
jgi:hypothetical protein